MTGHDWCRTHIGRGKCGRPLLLGRDRSRHLPVGSGWPYRVHHLIGEPTQAIEVQPDRRQDASIRPLAGTGENGSGGLGDVAPIQPLWAQQAR